MTKTYTEQWREGTLNGGYYYLKMKDGNIFIDHTEYIFWAHEIRWETKDSSYVKKVLAPVPNYDEWKELDDELKELATKNDTLAMENGRLQEQLAIATKALKKYAESDNWFEEDIHGEVWSFQKESKYPWRIGFKALKEMKGVK